MVNTTLANSLLRRLHTQSVQQNIQYFTTEHRGRGPNVLCLVQDNFLTEHVLEPTRAARLLDIVLSSRKEFVDNVVIQKPLGSRR